MAVENAIYSRAAGHAGLSALIGMRIYPGVSPQDVSYPAVVYQRISSVPESMLTADTNVSRDRYQFMVMALSYSELLSVSEQVRSAFQRWQGIEAGVTIDDSFLIGDVDLYQDETGVFQRAIDFEIINRG